MQLTDQILWQRIHYIITSYRLMGNDGEGFQIILREMLDHYPQAWIELSFIEVLVRHWHLPPLPRGVLFLQEAKHLLTQWRRGESCSQINASQFQCITGLTPLALTPLPSPMREF
jgi:hypothetical protein